MSYLSQVQQDPGVPLLEESGQAILETGGGLPDSNGAGKIHDGNTVHKPHNA